MTTASREVAGPADVAICADTGYRLADFEVPQATATLIAEAVPENTALAYRSRWRSFEAWCTRAGRVALPATAQTVAAYLTHLATERGLKATTVDAHLTAIRAVHRGAGATAPDALTARKVVVAAQRREAARDGRYGPRKAVPVMAADLPAIVAACGDQTAAGLRDRAVVLLGFALLARRSELAALNLSDVEHVPGEGLAVTIRASKTDQSARGLVRRIHYAANERVCPVRAVLAWTSFLAARGVTTGPLFTRIDRWGNVGRAAGGRYADPPGSDGSAGRPGSAGATRDGRLRPQAVGAIVTALCESAGLAGRPEATSPRPHTTDAADANEANRATDAAIPAAEARRYSGHSLRRGGATSMLAAGAQPLHVSRHGRWSDGSRSFAGYVEEATGFGDANPTKGLLLPMAYRGAASAGLAQSIIVEDSVHHRSAALDRGDDRGRFIKSVRKEVRGTLPAERCQAKRSPSGGVGPLDDLDAIERFTRLYDRYRNRVYAYAVSRAGRQLADEVVSEVFLVAWRRLDELPDDLLPWLLVTARNVIGSEFRAAARQESLAAELSSWSSGVASDIADEVSERQAVLRALAALPEADRELLTLSAWHGLSPRDAASVVGCSVATYFVRLHRARRRLEQAMADSPEPEHRHETASRQERQPRWT